jgi:orotate phosphoribosyltransferase-like protein
MRKSAPSSRGVLEVDWPFFGEICRALAMRVAKEYQPEIVLGIAKAGVIPGVVVASIMQCDFTSMVVTRQEEGAQPILVTARRPRSAGGGYSWWTRPATPVAP